MEMEKIQDTAELVSLGLTIPTVVLALVVVLLWGKEAIHILSRSEKWSEVDYLIVGIVIAFTGAAADNVYWGIAWTCSYLQLGSTAWWFENGVFANIPFRQCAGTIAAFYHLKGYAVAAKKSPDKWFAERVTAISCLLGFVYCVSLILAR